MDELGALLFLLMLGCCAHPGTCGSRNGILSFEHPSQICIPVSTSADFNEVPLEVPIVYYREKYDSVFVNARLISFGTSLSGGFKLSFQTRIPETSPRIPFLASLWTFPTDGEVCYWKTTNKTIISDFGDYLETAGTTFSNFQPLLLFVATWEEVQISPSNMPDPHMNATFQVILATDGRISFSQFRYNDIHSETEYIIGFNAGDGLRGAQLARQSGDLSPELEDILELAYRIDGDCVTRATSACHYTSYAELCSAPPNVITAINCSCFEGFTDININNTCEDIDECQEDPANCPEGLVCVNNAGNFTCEEPTTTPFPTTNPGTSVLTEMAAPSNSTALVAGLVVGFLLLLLIGVALVVVVLLTQRKKRWLLRYGVESHDYIQEINRPSLHYAGSMMQLVKLPKELKIPFEDLEFEAKMIGEGEFGTVYRAKYNKEPVAVKILKGISGTFEIRQVVEEIMRMRQFSHANILPLSGVAIDNHFSPCIIMPFMWNGSLDKFLQKDENTDKFLFPFDSQARGFEVDSATGKLLEICHQIALGMAYLSSVKVIHRDLAARNCMMDLNNVIKVADFGLSVSVGEDKDYFRLSDTNEKLPVKWMAVESLVDYKFSEASDVWSYGITCWEVFNGGQKPYPEIKNKDLLREVLEGYRMKKPPNRACNDSIYTIMKSCWEAEPSERPTFTDLVSQISSVLYEIRDYLPLINTQTQKEKTCNGSEKNSASTPPNNDCSEDSDAKLSKSSEELERREGYIQES